VDAHGAHGVGCNAIDIASIDTREQPTVYDVVITGVRAKDKFGGAEARNAEIKKHKHYGSHKQACINDTASHRDVRHSGGTITGVREGAETLL
jgi:hypothetical protein